LCTKQNVEKKICPAPILKKVPDPDHIDHVIAKWKLERPELDLTAVEIIGRAGRIMEYVDRSLEIKFEEFGATRAIFDVLATLRRNGPPYRMMQRELMQKLLRTSGSMSLRIDSLEREGLVQRVPDENDRRSILVCLTEKGAMLLDAIIPEHLANEKALLSGLTSAQKTELIALLRVWLRFLEENFAEGSQVYYGITLLSPQASLRKRRAVGLPDVPGMLVQAVQSEGVAELAGFRKGDLIFKVDEHEVFTLSDLRRILNKRQPSVKQIAVMRGSQLVVLRLDATKKA
jgi:DNA-binding MarR family transcriptional regulator